MCFTMEDLYKVDVVQDLIKSVAWQVLSFETALSVNEEPITLSLDLVMKYKGTFNFSSNLLGWHEVYIANLTQICFC